MPVTDPMDTNAQPTMSSSSETPLLIPSISPHATINPVPDVSVVVAPLPSLAPTEANIPALQVKNAGGGNPTDLKAIFPDDPNSPGHIDILAVPAHASASFKHQAVNDIIIIKNCFNSGLTLSNFEKCKSSGIDIFNKHLADLTKHAFQTTTLSASASASLSESGSSSTTAPSMQKSSNGLEIARENYVEVRNFLGDKLSHIKATLPQAINYDHLANHCKDVISVLNEGFNKALEHASAAETTPLPSLSLTHTETVSVSQSAAVSFTQSMEATHLVHDEL